MPERLNGALSKSAVPSRVPKVRILPPPPDILLKNQRKSLVFWLAKDNLDKDNIIVYTKYILSI